MRTTSSGTDRDTTLDVFTGTSVGTLSRVAGDDDPSADARLAVVTFDARRARRTPSPSTATGRPPAVSGRSASPGRAPRSVRRARRPRSPPRQRQRSLVQLTAAVTASFGTPVGHVYFYDGATVVGDDFLNSSSPSPTLTVTDLARRAHVFTAKFVPSSSDLYAESTSPDKTVTIAASATATTLVGSADAQQVTLTATVAPSAAGTVQFREGETPVGTGSVAYGKSTIVLTDVTPGAHSYTATFVPARTSTGTSAPRPPPRPSRLRRTHRRRRLPPRSPDRSPDVRRAWSRPSPRRARPPAGTVQVKDGDTVIDTATLPPGPPCSRWVT